MRKFLYIFSLSSARSLTILYILLPTAAVNLSPQPIIGTSAPCLIIRSSATRATCRPGYLSSGPDSLVPYAMKLSEQQMVPSAMLQTHKLQLVKSATAISQLFAVGLSLNFQLAPADRPRREGAGSFWSCGGEFVRKLRRNAGSPTN